MKTLTVRLPDRLAAEISDEARTRRVSKSDIVRDRLQTGGRRRATHIVQFDAISDLIGSVDGLSPDLSARKKDALRATGYGRKRPR